MLIHVNDGNKMSECNVNFTALIIILVTVRNLSHPRAHKLCGMQFEGGEEKY